MKIKSVATSCLYSVCLVAGADVVITDSVRLSVSSNTVLTARTSKQVEFPDNVGTPIFWLDCSDTNGWTFTAEGGVLKLPSKVPDSTRYLTSDKSDPDYENFSWKCFGYPNEYAVRDPVWLNPPVFTSPADGLAGYGVLDFGELGSRRALIFDLWSPDGSCVASNKLSDIGTVLAVYDSAEGGGMFLGGGGTTGYGWIRGRNRGATQDIQSYTDPLFLGPHAFERVYKSQMRHFGIPVSSQVVGFSGAWEVLTFCPAAGTAVLDATAVGGGDMRPASIPANFYTTSGGMRIAEMIFFGETLSEDDIRKVEAYLQSKWFVDPAGWNGNAVLSALVADVDRDGNINCGIDQEISAGEGETLSLQTIKGGQSGSTFVKTGSGRLAFGAAPDFNTPIEVREGTISFSRRAVPSDVPGRYVFRLDAMRTDLLTKDENNNVSRVDNCGGHWFAGRDIYLTTPYAKPKFVPDALGAGKPILDLGEVSDTGAFLKFATNDNTAVDIKVPGVCSIVAVVGAQNGGGSIAACRSLRRGNPVDRFSSSILTEDDGGEHCKLYVDGIGLDPTSGYPTPGYHVVAMQSAKADADGMLGFGAKLAKNGCGGLRIAEAVVYDRVLTDEELKDASAYLMNKWFGRVPGDYQNPSAAAGSVELQKLKLAEGTVVDVPEGGVARVGRLDIDYPAVKTGKGTLKIQSSRGAASHLTVQEGNVVFEAAPDVSSTAELAQGASLHLDASDAASFDSVEEGGTNFVLRWYSPGFGNLAYSNEGRRPWLGGTQTLNGRQTVEFGDYGTRSNGNYLVFGKALHSIRSAYILWRPHHMYASTLGSSRNSYGASQTSYDFISSNGNVFRNNVFSAIYTNGVPISRADLKVVPDEWVLVEVHSADVDTGGLTASALGADRDRGGSATTSYGGAEYAEIVLFERELSDREKVATRNYLLKKWLPSVAQTALPTAPEQKESVVAAIHVADGLVQSVASDETLAVGRLVGSGVLGKSGAGTLAVRDLADFFGTIDVAEGVLKLTGKAPSSTGPVTDGLVYHADATWGVTAETAADGVKKVVEWKSKLDDGWAAVPPVTWGDFRPRYMENALNGRPVVDLAVPADTNVLQCLRFKKDGDYALLSGLRTVLWVFGSQYGGGYILGGGDAHNDGVAGREWMRVAANQISRRRPTLDDPVLYGGADKAGRWGRWHVNGLLRSDTAENPTSPWLSGSWDILAWDTKTSQRNATADGFGFDRTIFEEEWADNNAWRMTGQQRLAEVLFYSRTLSDDELFATGNYLAAKWGLCGVRSTVTNAASVVLADGATLDMDATGQYLASLGGTGSVVNGIGSELTLGAISFDCNSAGCLSIASTVVIEEGFAVHFANFPAGGVNGTVKIADVSGFENRSVSSRITVTGTGGDHQAILRYRDGGLYVQILPKRFILLVR